jgi:hypothetical protein
MIISTTEEYNNLLDRMNREKYIFFPIFSDRWYHRIDNTPIAYAILFSIHEVHVLPTSHPDATSFTLLDNSNGISLDDVKIFYYLNNKTFTLFDNITAYTQDTYFKFENIRDINKIIPLTVWAVNIKNEVFKFKEVFDNLELLSSTYFIKLRETVSILRDIENEGIAVDVELLKTYFNENTLRCFKQTFVYSEYNPFTITGRPSNRFAGINFSALNKTDGVRKSFISRYASGQLVQFDFDAYHLRLLADDLNVPLPAESIHMHLAQMYYNTEEITPELYSCGKQKTFEIMYGISNETYGFELFEKIHKKRNLYKNKTSMMLPNGVTVNITDPSSNKLFNYYMQSLETVKTIPKLKKILELLAHSNNHLILYTYDSILLDMETLDSSLLSKITDILTEDNRYPVRMSVGKTYGDF